MGITFWNLVMYYCTEF